MIATCLDCERQLDHCHGTLVIHRTTEIECAADGCETVDVERHALVIDCGELAQPCSCAE